MKQTSALVPNHRKFQDRLCGLVWKAANHVNLAGLYCGAIQDGWVGVEEIDMHFDRLDPKLIGIKIALIADLHLGPLVREDYLIQFLDRINEMHVDFVAVAGDLITTGKSYARRAARLLRRLNPRVATVAVLGNHDYGIWHRNRMGATRGLREFFLNQLAEDGVVALANQCRVFDIRGVDLQFVGLEDLWSGHYDPIAAFELADATLPTITLCHNPDAAPELATFGSDWVLSGHTHGCSVKQTRLHRAAFPVEYPQFLRGRHALDRDKWLYVNRGLANTRRIRAEISPEITLFTLRRAPDSIVQLQKDAPFGCVPIATGQRR